MSTAFCKSDIDCNSEDGKGYCNMDTSTCFCVAGYSPTLYCKEQSEGNVFLITIQIVGVSTCCLLT